MSKIYLIERLDEYPIYDTYNAHVVVANSPDEARSLAAEIAADEGKETWAEAKVTVQGVAKRATPQIILSDFNAG